MRQWAAWVKDTHRPPALGVVGTSNEAFKMTPIPFDIWEGVLGRCALSRERGTFKPPSTAPACQLQKWHLPRWVSWQRIHLQRIRAGFHPWSERCPGEVKNQLQYPGRLKSVGSQRVGCKLATKPPPSASPRIKSCPAEPADLQHPLKAFRVQSGNVRPLLGWGELPGQGFT